MNDYDKSKGQKGLRRGCLIHGQSPLSLNYVNFHTLLLSHNAKMGSLISRCLGAGIVIRSFTIKDFFRRVTLAADTELLQKNKLNKVVLNKVV